MRALFLILFLLVATPVSAQIGILDADRATLELTITSAVTFRETGSQAFVSEAEADLSWIPRETWNQDIESIKTTPTADLGDTAIFTWNQPSFRRYDLTLTALLSTNNGITPVIDKPPFPLLNLGADLAVYTRPSLMIDMNDDIRRLANQLAAGKDDQYEVVFTFADWVTTSIEYDLNTFTADAVYPSSWVLEQRYGVCDEMTNLFISLNRAVGIPARFVSGLAYTEMDFVPDNWGGHGWAEVYFPEVGWIPFDVTYGEYGYVDSGHIKLKDSVDSQETSIEFTGSGFDFNIISEPLEFDVDILGTSPRNYEFIEAELTAFADEVRFGSYNQLTLRIKNLRDYYVSTRVELGETTQLTQIGSGEKNILLKPYEEQTVEFLVRVDEDLDSNFFYTFPVAAFTKLGEPAEISFEASTDGPMLGRNLFEQETSEKQDAGIDIQCDYDSPVKETANIECTFSSDKTFRGKACIDTYCRDVALGEETLMRNFSRTPGIYTIPVTFSNKDAYSSQFITLHILDETTAEIRDIQLPSTLRFGEEAMLNFTVVRTSESAPINAFVTVNHEFFSHTWEQESLFSKNEFQLRFTGNRLRAGDNTIEFIVRFEDEFGEQHEVNRIAKIALVDLTFQERVTLWLDSVNRWLESMLGSQ